MEIPRAATWLQIRADLIGDVPADWLRENFSGKLLYSLRSCRAGGKFEGHGDQRFSRLISAATDYDLVELEADSDLDPEVLAAIPAAKRMISYRSLACDVAHFNSSFQQIADIPARYYCVSTTAARTSDGLQPLLFLQALKRRDVIEKTSPSVLKQFSILQIKTLLELLNRLESMARHSLAVVD